MPTRDIRTVSAMAKSRRARYPDTARLIDHNFHIDAHHQYRFAFGDLLCFPLQGHERLWKFDVKTTSGSTPAMKTVPKVGPLYICHTHTASSSAATDTVSSSSTYNSYNGTPGAETSAATHYRTQPGRHHGPPRPSRNPGTIRLQHPTPYYS